MQNYKFKKLKKSKLQFNLINKKGGKLKSLILKKRQRLKVKKNICPDFPTKLLNQINNFISFFYPSSIK